MKELDYLNRFESDLKKILTSQNREDHTRQSVYSKIHSNVKIACEREITNVQVENHDLAAYLERFSNGLLSLISSLERSESIEKIRISAREDLLNDILERVRKELDILQAVENRDGEAEREKRDIRTIGERPISMKEKRSKTQIPSDDSLPGQ